MIWLLLLFTPYPEAIHVVLNLPKVPGDTWAECMTGPGEKMHLCVYTGTIIYYELTKKADVLWLDRECTLRDWPERCAQFDMDEDDDVDLRDVAEWTRRQSAGTLTLSECAELAPYLVPGD